MIGDEQYLKILPETRKSFEPLQWLTVLSNLITSIVYLAKSIRSQPAAISLAKQGASEYLVEKTENTRQGAPENIPPN